MPFWRSEPDPPVRTEADRRSQPVILVADDDRDTRELYRAFFDLSGFRTAEAANGHQTLLMARQLLPDVLLTDLVLPDIDGFTVARALKQDPRTAGIHLLLVTGYSFDGLDRKAADAGIERALIKPCLPQAMLREVRRALARPPTAPSEYTLPQRHIFVRDQEHDSPRTIVNSQRQDL
jgi:two-component system cell cycle response regulator DivK